MVIGGVLSNAKPSEPTRQQIKTHPLSKEGDLLVLHKEGSKKQTVTQISDVGYGPIDVTSPKPKRLTRIS